MENFFRTDHNANLGPNASPRQVQTEGTDAGHAPDKHEVAQEVPSQQDAGGPLDFISNILNACICFFPGASNGCLKYT